MREAGETFAHYTIEALLGRGGMGEVYRAFDTKLHRRVALKLLIAPEAASEDARKAATARMIREARAAAAVDHPNKVGVHELGEVDGVPYIAMEYIAGTTLRGFVGDDSVPRTKKLGWLLDVARALGAAHEAGLVHRDIKPENVMLREDGMVKVLDFGIARRTTAPVDASAPTGVSAIDTVTGAGVVIGTAAYMPPEQMHGEELDGRADQFAWGVMAFELLGGKHPWATPAGPMAMMTGMLTRSAPPLSEVWEDVPGAVNDAVARTLSAKRDDRYPTMADVVSALAPAAGQSGPTRALAVPRVADAPAPGSVTTHAAVTEHSGASEVTAVPAKSRMVRRLFLAIASFIALGATALVVSRRGKPPPNPYEYCIAWNMSVQGPRCELAADERTMDQRDHTYRLTSGPSGVMLVERLNSAGLAIGFPTVRTAIRRAPDGSVREVVELDQDGEENRHEVWSEGGKRIAYVEPDGAAPRHRDPESRITEARRRHDGHGFVEEEMFVGATGKPRADEEGTFGRRWERAPSGFVLRETYLAADGNPMAGRRGIAGTAYVLGPRGVQKEQRNLDVEGNTTTRGSVERGATVDRVEYSAALDLVGSTYFDADGRPVNAADEGIHGWRKEWDPAGGKYRVTFIDVEGKPRQLKGDSYSSMADTHDERGRHTNRTFLDPAGNPVVRVNASAGVTRMWDDRDHLVETRLLDAAGKPMRGTWGFASRTDVWDARGRIVEYRHFDEGGALTAWLEGTPVAQATYDDRGLLTEATNLGADLRPAAGPEGCATTRSKFDRLRNRIEDQSFGPDGKACASKEGVCMWRDRYDADDNLVETARFDVHGAPVYKTQDATIRWKHDDRGLVVEQAHYDTNDNLAVVKDGFAIVRYVLDRSGDATEESYFGKREEPVLRSGGYAKKKLAYDLARHRTESALLDIDGAPVMGSDGWSSERITYDERGLVTLEAYFDTSGKPVLTKAGSASIETRYDERGNVTLRVTLGTDGKPIAAESGFATKKSAYDGRDLLIEESLLSPAGAPALGVAGWATRRLRYDDVGNQVEEAFFDEERRPIVAKYPPYAMKRDKYDARRRLIETSYFDPSGVRAKGPEGSEIIRYVRDAYGHAVETAHFDGMEGPAFSTEGKHLVRSKFDDAGRLVEELFMDASGTLRTANDGCAGRRHKYDERGREIEETCLGEQNGLALSKAGWATKRSLRDVRGNVVDEATYGPDGKLTADTAGVARRKSRYDERNLRLDTTFFDAGDKPVKDTRGVASVRYHYDDAGKQTAETLLDEEGKPVVEEPKGKAEPPAREGDKGHAPPKP